jgi:hypothetical protein
MCIATSLAAVSSPSNADARAVQVRGELAVAGEALEAAEAHVLADLADQPLAHIFQRRTEAVLLVGQRGQGRQVGGVVLGDQHRRGVGQREEAVVLRDEVGLAVDLDHGAHAAFDIGCDDPLGRDAARSLPGLVAQLDAQELFGLFHVAVGLGQGLLALHHRGVGLCAQFADHACGDCSHLVSPFGFSSCGGPHRAPRKSS